MPLKENITTMEDKEINIVFFGNGTASHAWRINGIAKWLNEETPHACYVTNWTSWNNSLPEGTDIVILELLTSPEMVDKCHELGAKVIYEADDAFLDTYGKERKNLDHVDENHKQKTIETISKCDAMIVTNQVLKDNFARFVDIPIYVIPNYVDLNWYGEGKINIERTTDEVRIGWFGSRGHLEDLDMIVPAINQVLEKYKNAKFVYCGFGGMSSDRMVTEVGWGEDIFKDIPRDRREFAVGVREDIWPMKHRALDLDIGIAPLVDDYFNTCKTPIKWMEYAALGTPSVCSPTLYEGVVENEVTGFIAHDIGEWVRYLSFLVEDVNLRKSVGAAARETVYNLHNLQNHREEWVDVFKKVLDGTRHS